MAKVHVVVYRSIVVEEWLIIGATNTEEAKAKFHAGEGRLVSRSDFDTGKIIKVRNGTAEDFTSADLMAAAAEPTPAPTLADFDGPGWLGRKD